MTMLMRFPRRGCSVLSTQDRSELFRLTVLKAPISFLPMPKSLIHEFMILALANKKQKLHKLHIKADLSTCTQYNQKSPFCL